MALRPKCTHELLEREANLENSLFILKDDRHVYRCKNPDCGRVFIAEPFELKPTEKKSQSVGG